MQFVVLLPLLLLLWVDGLAAAERCLLYNGRCTSACPRNMHAYHTRCDHDTISQRTCAYPHSYVLGFTCGWSRCDCNNDLVLDEDLANCVPVKDCPDKSRSTKRPHRRSKKYRPVRLRLKDVDEEDLEALL